MVANQLYVNDTYVDGHLLTPNICCRIFFVHCVYKTNKRKILEDLYLYHLIIRYNTLHPKMRSPNGFLLSQWTRLLVLNRRISHHYTCICWNHLSSDSQQTRQQVPISPEISGEIDAIGKKSTEKSFEGLSYDLSQLLDEDTLVGKQKDQNQSSEQLPIGSMMESSSDSEPMDFQQLSNFIKEAYEKNPNYKEMERSPSAKRRQVDYFEALFSKYGGTLDRGKKTKTKSSVSDSELDRISSLKEKLRGELTSRCTVALEPTLTHFRTYKTSHELFQTAQTILNNFAKKLQIVGKKTRKTNTSETDSVKLTQIREEIFVQHLFRPIDKNSWLDVHEEYVNNVETQSRLSPENPICDVITLPIIFNEIIDCLAFKFNQGQLAMSLFDLIEKDFSFHTIAVNQDTYNLILRLVWVYYGNTNLDQFYRRYHRMTSLGFTGDVKTLNILKTVYNEYDRLKNGKLIFNNSNSPIYTPEDNIRMEYFEKEYNKLKRRLEHGVQHKDFMLNNY